jgi:phytoene dehydrogenase-like protein
MKGDIHAALGRIGLPVPVADLAAREWDAVVVGGGHNGLTCAAYLARAGKSVLVLEARERLGGACTLDQPFAEPEFKVSPCAYVVGLLDQRVIDELRLRDYGYRVFVAEPLIWCPFDDGTSYAQFLDPDRTVADMKANGFADADVEGQFAYEDFFDRMRIALRKGARDVWVGEAPDRDELEALLGHDPEMVEALWDTPVSTVIRRFVSDPRLERALYGQGIIGAWAGPHDPGTGFVKLMHFLGEIEGQPMAWGYVEGGMGTISFAIAEAARDLGAVLAAGVPVAEILPGEGVRLEGGELIRARAIVSNADPKATGRLCAEVDPAFTRRVEGWRIDSPVLKLNCGLSRLPRWNALPGADWPNRAPVSIAAPMDDAQAAFEACTRGEVTPAFAELYFHTAYDPTVAPEGKHVMSAFVQYGPYELAEGTWESRRADLTRRVLAFIGRYCDVEECVEHVDLLGPPDIEHKVGLTGGHIFHGECTPEQMWTNRFPTRTPMAGVYLCGAATHPAGGVCGLNGRNAADAVLADLPRSGP